MTSESLDSLRDHLKVKDEEIVGLLNERARISLAIGETKQKEGRAVYDPSQESRIYARLGEINGGPLKERALRGIFTEILSASRALQAPLTVAYLGPEGSFTHAAAASHFGRSTSLSPQPTIREIFDQVERGKADCGVVPVENSLEGTVKLTLDRLLETPLHIMGEVYLRVNHALLAKGSEPDRLKRIYSHPQALAQCPGWIRKHLPLFPTFRFNIYNPFHKNNGCFLFIRISLYIKACTQNPDFHTICFNYKGNSFIRRNFKECFTFQKNFTPVT